MPLIPWIMSILQDQFKANFVAMQLEQEFKVERWTDITMSCSPYETHY